MELDFEKLPDIPFDDADVESALSRLASPSNAAPLPADDSITNDFGSSPPATDARGMMGQGFNKVITEYIHGMQSSYQISMYPLAPGLPLQRRPPAGR
jgi:hypothetical protein